MSTRVTCPGCGAAYSFAANPSGKNVHCKRCGQVFRGDTSPRPTKEELLEVLPVDEPTTSAPARRGSHQRERVPDGDQRWQRTRSGSVGANG
jgi:predicted Zn finger-like uncharacterized protein